MPLTAETPDVPSPGIALDKLTFIIERAREFDVKEGDSDPDEGSNPTDDGNADILEDQADDATAEELAGAIGELNDDERTALVALAWLGRGTFDLEEWNEALATAKSEHGGRHAATAYLLAMPLLGDYLEDGLALFGDGIVDEDDKRESLDDEDEAL